MNEITDPIPSAEVQTTNAPWIEGHRYPTPTGEPCPRTIRVDGTIDNGGNCQSCGTCLLYIGIDSHHAGQRGDGVGLEPLS